MKVFLSMLLGFFAASGLSGQTVSVSISTDVPDSVFQEYRALNEEETRLPEYKDADEVLRLKLQQLEHVNKSRRKFGAADVKLDILACRVANKQAKEAAEIGFSGHWNLLGHKPYHRWAFSGGLDHVTENAAAVFASYTLDPAMALGYMQESHDRFMAEKPPNDGHKKTVIDPDHTHVGLGFAFHEGNFRYYEEYLDRYLEFSGVPSEAEKGTEVAFAVRSLDPGLYLYAVVCYYEAFPKSMSKAQVEAKGSYPDYTNSTAFITWPNKLVRAEDGSYAVSFTPKNAGLYYVQLYMDDKPYSGSGSMSTSGKLQASGVVISVK